MSKPGPAPTPTAVLRMRGSWRAKSRPAEPQPAAVAPRCPAWLTPDARVVWRAVIGELRSLGVLARCDGNPLARYCLRFVRWRRAELFLAGHGSVDSKGNLCPQVAESRSLSESLRRIEEQFGLLPAARNRIPHVD